MASSTSPTSQYPPLPVSSDAAVYDSGYRYEDPTQQAAQIQQSPPSQQLAHYAEQGVNATPSATPSKTKGTGEAKPRLRKACDSCSVRKVKCDESGPPCKSCAALDIPCTFNRPSRRRGPPNRHAEAIKRQKLDDGSYNFLAASPTRDAAYGLAALSGPLGLSAESICDIQTLSILVDDYFTYIHPLIPVPHEPTFRAQFARRDDRTDRSFLALLAAMVEALVASFPRRPRQLFTSDQARAQFPHAAALTERCRQVFNEARGIGFLDHRLGLYDACGSYCAAIAAAYQYDMIRLRLYISETVMILRILKFHRVEAEQPQSEIFSVEEIPSAPPAPDYVFQQVGRRLFWLCFVGAMTMRQLGGQDSDILMPPTSNHASLPPLPVEVDDEHITSSAIYGQPDGTTSLMTGFNLNVRIFRAFHSMTAVEIAFGADTLFDWDRQRQLIRRALATVKNVTAEAPSDYKLESKSSEFGEWPPRQGQGQGQYSVASQYSHLFNGVRDPNADQVGLLPPNDHRRTTPYPKRAVQLEIQKANIYGTELATRSYLVERFWNLYEIHEKESSAPTAFALEGKPSITSSPTIGIVSSGLENRYHQSRSGKTPSESHMDAGEQAMAVEREDIIRDMAKLLKSVNQVNMEPNGQSFCSKIRQVASTLLSQDRSRMSVMPTLDSQSVNEYLLGFCEILSQLERLGPGRLRGSQSSDGSGQMKTVEEIEEEELVHWASLKQYQERFVMQNEGYLGNL